MNGVSKIPLVCSGHTRPVPYLQFSNVVDDGQVYLISASKDNTPMLRDGVTGDWIGSFLGHKGAVWSARMNENATKAVTASADFTAKVWDTYNGDELLSLPHNSIVRSADFSHSSEHIVTGGQEKILRQFSINGGQIEHESKDAHDAAIKTVFWMDHHTLISSGDDKKVKLWDTRTNKPIRTHESNGNITSVAKFSAAIVSSIGKNYRMAVTSSDKSIIFFDEGLQITKTIADLEYVPSTCSVWANSLITGDSNDLLIRVHDFDSGVERDKFKGHHGPVHCVEFSTAEGRLFASGSEDGTIRLWKNCEGPYGLWQ